MDQSLSIALVDGARGAGAGVRAGPGGCDAPGAFAGARAAAPGRGAKAGFAAASKGKRGAGGTAGPEPGRKVLTSGGLTLPPVGRGGATLGVRFSFDGSFSSARLTAANISRAANPCSVDRAGPAAAGFASFGASGFSAVPLSSPAG